MVAFLCLGVAAADSGFRRCIHGAVRAPAINGQRSFCARGRLSSLVSVTGEPSTHHHTAWIARLSGTPLSLSDRPSLPLGAAVRPRPSLPSPARPRHQTPIHSREPHDRNETSPSRHFPCALWNLRFEPAVTAAITDWPFSRLTSAGSLPRAMPQATLQATPRTVTFPDPGRVFGVWRQALADPRAAGDDDRPGVPLGLFTTHHQPPSVTSAHPAAAAAAAVTAATAALTTGANGPGRAGSMKRVNGMSWLWSKLGERSAMAWLA